MPTLSPLPHGAGHGFISEHQWAEVQSACGEEFKKPGKPAYSAQCQARLAEASDAAGKFYVYDIYDTCNDNQLKQSMDAKAHAGGAEPLNATLSRSHTTGTLQQLQKTYALGAAGGGPRGEPAYSPYGCGKNAVTQHWLNLPGAPVRSPPYPAAHALLGPVARRRMGTRGLAIACVWQCAATPVIVMSTVL